MNCNLPDYKNTLKNIHNDSNDDSVSNEYKLQSHVSNENSLFVTLVQALDMYNRVNQ